MHAADLLHPSGPDSRPPLSNLVREVLEAGLIELMATGAAAPDADLRVVCRTALEQLWDRRDALARVLQRMPAAAIPARAAVGTPGQAGDGPSEHEAQALDDAADRAADAFRDALCAALPAHRDLDTPPHDEWPHSPARWASTLRWIAERSSSRHDVRIELMRFGTHVLVPLFVESWRRRMAQIAVTDAAPAGVAIDGVARAQATVDAPADPPPLAADRVPTFEELVDAMQPGCRLRMVLMGQWTDVCVTWRSTHARFFMLSSDKAGRSHSIGLRGLETLIANRQIRLSNGSPNGVSHALRHSRPPLATPKRLRA